MMRDSDSDHRRRHVDSDSHGDHPAPTSQCHQLEGGSRLRHTVLNPKNPSEAYQVVDFGHRDRDSIEFALWSNGNCSKL